MVPFAVVRQLFLLSKKDEYMIRELEKPASGVDGSLLVLKTFCKSTVVPSKDQAGLPHLPTLRGRSSGVATIEWPS